MIERLGLKPIKVSQHIKIELPDGVSVLTHEMLLGESIVIHGLELAVDLIVFGMPDFDVILGMDFLGRYGVKTDYQKKKVRFNLDSGNKFSFREGHQLSMLISSVKARKMLRKGCSRYIAHVMQNSDVLEPEIQNVLVVREFLDVFPEDLPGLPSKREVEFSIELAPRTALISKALYRMAPTEEVTPRAPR